jgi:opacity protein-like surface antigen
MKRIGAVVLFIVLFLPTAAAFAQMGVYIGGFAGYSAQKPSFEDVQFTTDTTFFYGFRGGIRFLMLALEVSYFRAMHNIAVNDFLTLNWDGRINDFSYIGLNLKYIFSLAIFHPYLTGGYGYYTADIENIDKDKEGGVNIGAGLEISLGKTISIAAEGKYHHVAVDIQRIHVGLGNFMISGGLNIHF